MRVISPQLQPGNCVKGCQLSPAHAAQLGSRIEEVVRFEEAVPCVLNAEEDFNLRRLMRLFDRRAMLVPFKDSPTVGVLSILKDVMSFWLRGSPNSIVTTGEWHGMM